MPENQWPDWIPCTERLPEKGEEVLVYVNDEILVANYSSGGWWNYEFKGVTHWMPLPPPPPQKQKPLCLTCGYNGIKCPVHDPEPVKPERIVRFTLVVCSKCTSNCRKSGNDWICDECGSVWSEKNIRSLIL